MSIYRTPWISFNYCSGSDGVRLSEPVSVKGTGEGVCLFSRKWRAWPRFWDTGVGGANLRVARTMTVFTDKICERRYATKLAALRLDVFHVKL